MPSVVATIKVKPDKVEEAKTFLKQLAADTLQKEKGTLVYQLHQRKDDPTTFVFYEKYESSDALKEHGKNLAAVGKEFGALLAGAPEIVYLDEL
jgi:quinol monooxygenase YgiN